jgi:hypothetical protein
LREVVYVVLYLSELSLKTVQVVFVNWFHFDNARIFAVFQREFQKQKLTDAIDVFREQVLDCQAIHVILQIIVYFFSFEFLLATFEVSN